MGNLKQLWERSLLFRRVITASVLMLAAGLVSVGSRISRAVSLPDKDLNDKSVARVGEDQIVLKAPRVGEGDVVVSYTGSRNETGEVWLEYATLDARSQRLFGGAAGPGRISYTSASEPGTKDSADTCHTAIKVSLAKGSAPIDALKLYQMDAMAGAQRFRQMVLDAGRSTLEIAVHTDPPAGGKMDLPGCRKLLTVGSNAPVEMPPLPVYLSVQGGKVDLHFNPTTASVQIWTGEGQTFDAVSLGDGAIRASDMQVVSTKRKKSPPLDVRAKSASEGISFSHLQIGAYTLKMDVGRDGERAEAYADGKSMYTFDLVEKIDKNRIASGVLGVFLLPWLWNWVRKNCFPVTKIAVEERAE